MTAHDVTMWYICKSIVLIFGSRWKRMKWAREEEQYRRGSTACADIYNNK